MAKKRGEEPNIPPNADIGYRANNALIAHEENHRAAGTTAGEAGAVRGRAVVRGQRLPRPSVSRESAALGCVLGWTIGNDVSERGWQTR